ncbi:MAG TPA: hypothetical protein VIM79_14355 [Niastella sp.]
MFITINNDYNNAFTEDVLLRENDYIVGLFAEICRIIDDLKLAKFSVLFKDWDKRFNSPDFVYDFSDVAPELPELVSFLQSKSGEYSLAFHELDREIKFKFNDEILFFTINEEDNVLYHGELDAIKFKTIIETLINDFSFLLAKFFPKSYEVFKKEKYIIS